MHRYLVIQLAGAALLLAACAQKSSDIPAAHVSTSAYSNVPCATMIGEYNAASIKLAELSGKQDAARAADTAWMVGGGLVFFPAMAMAATGPDYADQIADLKGATESLRMQIAARGC
jgi:hypothetical protein